MLRIFAAAAAVAVTATVSAGASKKRARARPRGCARARKQRRWVGRVYSSEGDERVRCGGQLENVFHAKLRALSLPTARFHSPDTLYAIDISGGRIDRTSWTRSRFLTAPLSAATLPARLPEQIRRLLSSLPTTRSENYTTCNSRE